MEPRRSWIDGAFLISARRHYPLIGCAAALLVAAPMSVAATSWSKSAASPAEAEAERFAAIAQDAAATPGPSPVLEDPSAALALLSADPFVRVMRAEQVALATRRREPVALELPSDLSGLSPTIAKAAAQTFAALAAPPPPTYRPQAGRTYLARALRRPGPMIGADGAVAGAIVRASLATGVDQAYLRQAAAVESGFNPYARAGTSSARGLYQFVDATWLNLIRQHGHRYGLDAAAQAIGIDAAGRPRVSDPAWRNRILAMRYDPDLSALLAGELTRDNAQALAVALDGPPTAGDLYIAHFLGADEAIRLIRTARQTPLASAPALFPRAAAANRPLFYQNGRPMTAFATYLALKAKGEAT